jgi:hypothetical protein
MSAKTYSSTQIEAVGGQGAVAVLTTRKAAMERAIEGRRRPEA